MEEVLEIIKRLGKLRSEIDHMDQAHRTEENEVYRGAVAKIKEETLNLVAALSTSKLDQLKNWGEEVVERIASVIPKERMQHIGDEITATLSEGVHIVRRAGSRVFKGLGDLLDPDKSDNPDKQDAQ